MEDNNEAPTRTWRSVLASVKIGRRFSSKKNVSVASSFSLDDSFLDGHVRIYALGKEHLSSKEQTLVFVDVPQISNNGTLANLNWKTLVQQSQELTLDKKLTRDEELQQERMRIRACGITSYESDSASNSVTFTAGAQIFRFSPTNEPDRAELSMFQPTPFGAPLNVTVCPSDTSLIAFVCSGDIYLHSGDDLKRATHASTGPESATFAGTPAFVYQEEFDRFAGFWWEPKESVLQKEANTHYLLYEETDENEVMKVSLCVPGTVSDQVEQMRYPRAGTANAKSTLKLLRITVEDESVANTEARKVIKTKEFEMQSDLFELFPWAEYLVRVGWVPHGKAIWVQLMSREQNRLALVYVPLEFFITKDPTTVTVLLEEQTDLYLHVHEHLYFISWHEPGVISFIWCSEGLGHSHLYLVESKYTVPSSSAAFFPISGPTTTVLQPITSGLWSVARSLAAHLDMKRGHIYFVGYKDTPLEQHLYVTSYQQLDLEAKRLTEAGLSHMCDIQNKVAVNSDLGLFVDVCTGFNQPPQCRVYRLHFDSNDSNKCPVALPIALVSSTPLGDPPNFPVEVLPELFTYTSSTTGFDHYGILFRTPKALAGGQHPTIVYVYGGPNVQIVRNIYYGNRFGFQTFCELGFNVVVIDGRGSDHRGLQFEAAIRHRMGTIEVDDQVEGLRYIAQQSGVIDMNRIGIFGWSYGGYMALMCLARKPDIFKVAISGAPVTEWELYDTGYTERYMSQPKNNPDGYTSGSVVTFAQYFPDQPNRLLILHGLNDENVHFAHTATLISALIREGKPYQLHISPSERHSARGSEAGDHMDCTINYFFVQHL